MNKRLFYILLLVFMGCSGSNTEHQSMQQERVVVQSNPPEDTLKNPKIDDQLLEDKPTINIPKFQFKDTLAFEDGWFIVLKRRDSVEIKNYWLSQKLKDSLGANVFNSHRKAMIIEQYQLSQNNDSIIKNDSARGTRYLKLFDGSWQEISINPEHDEAGSTFEFYFQDWQYYSLRIQYGEGNAFRLVNRHTGKETNIGGRPYFSPDGKFVIGIHMDITAQYSYNGIELFLNKEEELVPVGRYSPENWGIVNAMWVAKNQAILHCQAYDYTQNSAKPINYYLDLTVARKY